MPMDVMPPPIIEPSIVSVYCSPADVQPHVMYFETPGMGRQLPYISDCKYIFKVTPYKKFRGQFQKFNDQLLDDMYKMRKTPGYVPEPLDWDDLIIVH
jgi:hypothetical protein